jgi:hypothetical protein
MKTIIPLDEKIRKALKYGKIGRMYFYILTKPGVEVNEFLEYWKDTIKPRQKKKIYHNDVHPRVEIDNKPNRNTLKANYGFISKLKTWDMIEIRDGRIYPIYENIANLYAASDDRVLMYKDYRQSQIVFLLAKDFFGDIFTQKFWFNPPLVDIKKLNNPIQWIVSIFTQLSMVASALNEEFFKVNQHPDEKVNYGYVFFAELLKDYHPPKEFNKFGVEFGNPYHPNEIQNKLSLVQDIEKYYEKLKGILDARNIPKELQPAIIWSLFPPGYLTGYFYDPSRLDKELLLKIRKTVEVLYANIIKSKFSYDKNHYENLFRAAFFDKELYNQIHESQEQLKYLLQSIERLEKYYNKKDFKNATREMKLIEEIWETIPFAD